MKFKYIILFLQILGFNVAACSINEEILGLNANAIAVSIQRGITVERERINDSFLDFAHPCPGDVRYDPASFLSLIMDNAEIAEHFKLSLRHNRLGMFIHDCQSLHDQAEINLYKKYALYKLLSQVLKKSDKYIETTQHHQSSCRSSEESKNTDITESTLLSDSEDDMLCDKSVSIFMEHQAARPPLQKLSIINLDSKAFFEDSFTYFKKQLVTVRCPIRITSNLHHLKMSQINNLSDTISEIDQEHNLVEIILMNGSSRKFNIIFSLLESIYNKHVDEAKPISIVYSTTSETQLAYKKLYTLRGVIALPHSYIDEVIGLSPSLTLAIQSPEKKSCVIDIQEESADEVKLNQVAQRLKAFTQPLIIQTSKNLSKLSDLFAQLTVTS